MTEPTDLRDSQLEDRIRVLLHDRAETISGSGPGLDSADRSSFTVSHGAAPQISGSRRRLAVGIAAAVLAAGAAGVALTRPGDRTTEAISTVATEPDQIDQAAPGETRVLVVNGSRWEGEVTLEILMGSLSDLGIGQTTGEIASDLASSGVYYRPGFEAVASQVAFQAHMTGQETPLPDDLASIEADIVVELGQDWDPFASDEVRGEPSNLPYVPATVSDSLQLRGRSPWPGPGNDGDPAETPVAAVRSFLSRVLGVEAAQEATVEELFQFPVEGHRLGRVRVTFSGGATTEAHVGRVDGQDRWTLSVMVTTSGNDDPWGGRSGPLPFAADSDEAAIEKYIAYPEGAVSARLWYRHEEGPTMVVDLDHETLEAGYQDQLDEYNHYGMGDHPRNELFIDSDRVSLGSGVLLKGSLTSGVDLAAVYYDEQGEPITVFLNSF